MVRRGNAVNQDERDQFVREVTADWQYSWSPLVVEGETWVAVCGDEVESDEPRLDAPFPFVVKGRAPSREVIAELLDEQFTKRVSKTYYTVEEIL